MHSSIGLGETLVDPYGPDAECAPLQLRLSTITQFQLGAIAGHELQLHVLHWPEGLG